MAALRILTANLWKVDVACLQELAPEQAGPVASVLPHGALGPARDYTGMGIALRRPAEVASLPLRYRPVRATRLDPKDWPGLPEPLAVWNVHVRAPHSFPQPVSLAIRKAQLAGLLGHLDRARAIGALVLMGDFNATPLWPVYRQVARELDDVALASARLAGRRPARTWGPPRLRKTCGRLLRIDHAFARGVQVCRVRSLEIPGSDHDALCVDVEPG
jgi:endonuclease/exonuclease/phosphatase family metal-dependent hydrolase